METKNGIPVISGKSDLTRDEAVAELQELTDVERPEYGFASWVDIKIEQRKADLCKMIANTFLRKQKDGN